MGYLYDRYKLKMNGVRATLDKIGSTDVELQCAAYDVVEALRLLLKDHLMYWDVNFNPNSPTVDLYNALKEGGVEFTCDGLFYSEISEIEGWYSDYRNDVNFEIERVDVDTIYKLVETIELSKSTYRSIPVNNRSTISDMFKRAEG